MKIALLKIFLILYLLKIVLPDISNVLSSDDSTTEDISNFVSSVLSSEDSTTEDISNFVSSEDSSTEDISIQFYLLKIALQNCYLLNGTHSSLITKIALAT